MIKYIQICAFKVVFWIKWQSIISAYIGAFLKTEQNLTICINNKYNIGTKHISYYMYYI